MILKNDYGIGYDGFVSLMRKSIKRFENKIGKVIVKARNDLFTEGKISAFATNKRYSKVDVYKKKQLVNDNKAIS